MINLELLSSFAVFAEHLNLTHAARALHISQPALHAQLQRLSEELEVTLYIREGRRLRLTEAGERVVGFGRDLESLVERFKDELHHRAHDDAVTLVSGEGAFRYLLGDAIRDFKRAQLAPLQLKTARGAEIENAVRLGQAQLGVTASDQSSDDLERTLLTEVSMALALPTEHPLASRGCLELDDLEGMKLIVPPLGRPHRNTLEVALSSAGISWEVAVEAMGWELSLHFVALGLGMSVINGFCTPPQGVALIPLKSLPSRAYYLVQRRHTRLSTGSLALRDALIKRADHWRAHLAH